MGYRVNLVEDELNLNELLVSYMEKEGWEVTAFTAGEPARAAISRPPHLWILDIMLPDLDGYQLIREIKAETPEVPVIFISARDADLDRVIGLEMGSDDYLPKPFLPRELMIRARNILERAYKLSASTEATRIHATGPYHIDEDKRIVIHGTSSIDLSSMEFDLLLWFVRHPGQAFSREQLLQHVWGADYYGTDRAVDDLVRRLRKRLPELRVETIYGFGYRMVKA
ncbi:response regulator transcription factor [Marinicrinis sediminis]|uniref:Response regulator transcription factor n=1 Tax=Marinicrinis sediminis TaxID=1652465 RepID=A0ABW5R805_9BACL